jgi:O-antigen/teichoic acid export membrane protein
LHATSDEAQLRQLYHQAAQFLAVLVGPLGVTLAVFPDAVLTVWTGDARIVEYAAPILRWLAVGSTLVAATNVPYALQLALGWTRIPFTMNLVATLVLLPVMAGLAWQWGGVGAAWAWSGFGLTYLLVTVPLSLRWLLPGATRSWIWRDNLAPLASALAVACVLRGVLDWSTRWDAALVVASVLAAGYVVAWCIAPTTRQWMLRRV